MKQSKPFAEIRTATKELVDYLLSLNTSNRVVKRPVLDTYIRDIKAGNWLLTNQGIGVTSDMVIADGQHRLLSLKACGYPPVELVIVWGLDPAAQTVIDTHSKRTSRDAIQFAFGVRVHRAAPAIASVLIRNDTGRWSGAHSNHEIMKCISDYQDEIADVVAAPSKANFFAAPYLAAFCFALSLNQSHKDRVIKFIQDVESGEMLSKDMPEYHLRNLMMTTSNRGSGGRVQQERFIKAHKAIIASLRNQKMGVLRA
jgi:hypothetical protein